jgi:hypothetical protein
MSIQLLFCVVLPTLSFLNVSIMLVNELSLAEFYRRLITLAGIKTISLLIVVSGKSKTFGSFLFKAFYFYDSIFIQTFHVLCFFELNAPTHT